MLPAVEDDPGRSLLRTQAPIEVSRAEREIISNRTAVTNQLLCHVCHSTRSGLLLGKESGLISLSSLTLSCPSPPRQPIVRTEDAGFGREEQKWLQAIICGGSVLQRGRVLVHRLTFIKFECASGPQARSQLGFENWWPRRSNIRSYFSTMEKTKGWNGCVRFWHAQGILQPMTYLPSQVAFEVWQHELELICVFVSVMNQCFTTNINNHYQQGWFFSVIVHEPVCASDVAETKMEKFKSSCHCLRKSQVRPL